MPYASWTNAPSRRVGRKTFPAFTPICVALSLALPGWAYAAGPLPSGGHFVAGSGSIAGNATALTIDQSSSKGIIDWTRFSIGPGNRVDIRNGTGGTLNRVTGGSLSAILGTLTATGSVYLINPQGIVVGSSGVVSTGGRFVASTLDTDNTAFMQGDPLTFSGKAAGNVVNLGRIASSGGDVFLIAGHNVDNLGTISAPQGTAELATGQTVLLQDSSTSQQVFVQTAGGGTVLNGGAIEAAQIDLQAADGNIFALAGNDTALRATGTTTRDGHVWLVADTGNVALGGTIEARDADGGGGTVDTSAGALRILFDPAAPLSVKANEWNVTTPEFTVNALAATVFQRSLNNGTSINLQTTGAGGEGGDIDVASSIQWSGAASLTLGAYRSLTIDAAAKLKNIGKGDLTLRADSTGIDNGGSIGNNGTVDWAASRGIVSAFYDMNGSYEPGTVLANGSWVSPQYSGIVTQITGYKLVNSVADLAKVSGDLAGNYALGTDIDASATSDGSYVPIGSDTTPFSGQFDGEGHVINFLTLHGETAYATPVTLGLFGTLGASAIVRDLNVSGKTVIANVGPYKAGVEGVEGILAANNYGTVLRVGAYGQIQNLTNAPWYDSTTDGGLVGVNHGTIVDSSSRVFVNTGGAAGGLVGENDGVIYRSSASGPVQSQDMVGGVQESSGTAGGLVALNNGTISQSFSTGPVGIACETYACGAGGLVDINNGTISQSYETGDVSLGCPTDCTAPLVNVNTGTITQSFATGWAKDNFDPNTGNPVVSGIAATNDGDISNDVYWNKETSTATAGVGSGLPLPDSNGLTTAQMSDPASFSGWDFGSNGVWAEVAGVNHPVLRWQLEPPAAH